MDDTTEKLEKELRAVAERHGASWALLPWALVDELRAERDHFSLAAGEASEQRDALRAELAKLQTLHETWMQTAVDRTNERDAITNAAQALLDAQARYDRDASRVAKRNLQRVLKGGE
jgi:hypothetical protein